MTEKITLGEALKLVSFMKNLEGDWKLLTVYGDVNGDIHGDVHGDVRGDVRGDVLGDIRGGVHGDVNARVLGKINGRSWQSVETPQERLERLILNSGDQELIEAFNQLQENN